MSSLAATMPPKARGEIFESPWNDGRTVMYRIRVPFNGQRYRLTLGTNREGWSRERAQVELDQILDRIARGTWQPPTEIIQATADVQPDESFQVTASRWWQAKEPSLNGESPGQYRWALTYLLHEFGTEHTAGIDSGRVRRFRDRLLAERSAQEKAGGKGLSNRSINVLLQRLSAILDDAVEDKVLPANPVTKRHRLPSEKKQRAFLEPDMVRDMLNAASLLEREARRDYKLGRRAIIATLTLSGVRRHELCDALIGHVDLAHSRLTVPDSKTQAGIREIELPLWLVDELRSYIASLPSLGQSTAPGAYLFPTSKGGRRDPDRLNDRIVVKAAERASTERAERGLPPLPRVTPHALRRTYASLAIAAGRDPKFVMAQLGHTDPEFTLRVYAQVVKRQRQDKALIWELMRFADEPETPPGGRNAGPNGPDVRATDQATSPLHSSDDSGKMLP